MKEPSEQGGQKEPTQQARVREPSATVQWTVVVLLIIAALILLLPLPNLAETHFTSRIVLSTIVLAICGGLVIWHKPVD